MLLLGSHFEGKIRFHLPAPIVKFTRPPVRVRHQIDRQADQPEERGGRQDATAALRLACLGKMRPLRRTAPS